MGKPRPTSPKMASWYIWIIIILGLGYLCDGLRPRLNVSDEFVVDNRTQDSFTIRCEGTEKLYWDWTASINPTDTDVVSIDDEHHPSTDFPYVSTLTIKEPYNTDTGFFYCHYEGVTNYAQEEDKVATTYVYVYDGESGLVSSWENSIDVNTDEKLVLDCRPTMPNISITLWKDGSEVSRGDGRIVFDPKHGYSINNLVAKDAGHYECRAHNNDNSNFGVLNIIVNVRPGNSRETKLPKPAIDWNANQHFVVGHSFTINCSLLIDKDIAFHWTWPNSASDHKIILQTPDMRKDRMYRVSSFHVPNATKEDSGDYKCRVTASGKNSNEETRKITVHDDMVPYVNISSIPIIYIMEGEHLRWKAEVRAFPPDPQIIYRDYRGMEVKESDRVTTEHHIGNAVSWLKIQNISAADFGNYTIEVILDLADVRESKTVLIVVKSKPSPKILGIPSFVEENKKLKPVCVIEGYPEPEVTWSFQACPNGYKDCSSDFDSIEAIEVESVLQPPGNVIKSNISISPKESGILRCQAENEHGLVKYDYPLSISDIGGNLVFRISRQGSDTIFTTRQNRFEIVVDDSNFEVFCGTTKSFYSTASLNLPGINLEIYSNDTKYSRREWVRSSKVTKDLAGKYQCSGTRSNDSVPVIREVMIRVLDQEPVTFVNSNMDPDGKEIELQEHTHFNLMCTVSGIPTPQITWFKDDEPLLPDSDFFDGEQVRLEDKGQTIYFEYVYEKHAGEYSCAAKNRLNKITGYLTITFPSPGLSLGAKVGLSMAVVGIVVLVFVVLYLVKRVKNERKFRKSFRQNELYLFEKGNIGQLNPDCTADEQAELLPYDPTWEVDRDNIKIGKQLGAGAFGRVVKALVMGLEEDKPQTTVAVKMCKSQADQSQVRALALELKIMIHLGQHLNIVNLMGANTVHIGKGELWILVEYCRFGNLLSFMHRHRNKFINQIDPVTGKIDVMKVTSDGMSPFSPGSNISSSRGFQPGVITDLDGYLSPSVSKFSLASPPHKRQTTTSPPETPSSMTGSVNGVRPHVDNPMYNLGLQKSVSEHPDGEPAETNNSGGSAEVTNAVGGRRLNSITSLERERRNRLDSVAHSDDSGRQMLNSTSHSDTGSVGYCQGHITNTDMTTVPMNLLSPLSPTDSSHASEMGLDSKGNPFVYDAGIVPAVTAPFTTSDLVCWAWQVAQGMDYLSQRKVLHGDLAARNLLLADDNVIKISDFGLSREMYKKDVYMKKGDDLMPIKWMAIEAIRDRIFSVQSDVWAYGVALWEIFTLGSTPYPGIEVNKDFLKLIEEGYRMDKPKCANMDVYDIILTCWESDPRLRPSFAQAAEQFGNLMLPDLKGQYMNMNDPYLRMNEERFREGTDYLNMLASPNFDNLNRDDDAKLHYVNVGEASIGSRDSNYLDMKSPNTVGYSRVGFNPSMGESDKSIAAPKSNYLPMSSGQTTPSPLVDVFSPRPDEVPRFTFVPNTSERPLPSRLTDLPEEEEIASQTQLRGTDGDLTERSSLISSPSVSSSREDVRNNEKLENTDPPDGITVDKDAFYVNLPTHGVDYANL
ncbi:vascular endothelial growth factor receptor 1-like isoform X2 [Palaemon carinicauda]|uniref:vascular endothelial growth factor receptor 1-like isoform X2 n=1 Tax=Palaemon carinicauda TaxID=392227 RepID=UPI0035B65C97